MRSMSHMAIGWIVVLGLSLGALAQQQPGSAGEVSTDEVGPIAGLTSGPAAGAHGGYAPRGYVDPGRSPGAAAGGPAGAAGPPRAGGRGGETGAAEPAVGFGPRGRAAATARRKKAGARVDLSWRGWWRQNRDHYLDVRSRAQVLDETTRCVDLFMGEAQVTDPIARSSRLRLRREAAPALIHALHDPSHEVRIAAALALGKCGGRDAFPRLIEALGDHDRRVRESVILGLGLLGEPTALPLLTAILEGREIVPGTGTSHGERDLAAIAIGLVAARGDNRVVRAAERVLVNTLERADERRLDDIVPTLVALGLLGTNEVVPRLIDLVQSRTADAWIRAHAASALGRIGDRGALPYLVHALGDRDAPVVQSAAVALGQLAEPRDDTVTRALAKTRQDNPDLGAQGLVVAALGQIGGRRNRAHLLDLVRRSSRRTRTFAAVALSVSFEEPDAVAQREVGLLLAHRLRFERNPTERGACAIALGLLSFDEAGPDLARALVEGGADDLQADLCLGLGLLGFVDAAGEIHRRLDASRDPELRRDAAIALGLLRDRTVLGLLHRDLESPRNLAICEAATTGLGYLGDVSAVSRLRSLAVDRHGNGAGVRAFAVRALGLLVDKDDVSLLHSLARTENYLTRSETVSRLLSQP